MDTDFKPHVWDDVRPNGMNVSRGVFSINAPYSYSINEDGEERFEYRAGTCNPGPHPEYANDCEKPSGGYAGRQENYVEPMPFERITFKPNFITYEFEIWFPKDYANYVRDWNMETIYIQVKHFGDRVMWDFYAREYGLWWESPTSTTLSGNTSGKLIRWEDLKGKWTKFTVNVDYDTNRRLRMAGEGKSWSTKNDYSFIQILINDKDTECVAFEPLAPDYLIHEHGLNPKNAYKFSVRYGIYNVHSTKDLDMPPQIIKYRNVNIYEHTNK